LIFGNRKSLLEEFADYANAEAQRRHVPNGFRIHHGSLSKAEREDTEEALRTDPAVATFCSSTLEMGIDVGNVKAVGQVGPPWSVNSLAQRLGRSGRKEGEPSVMRMYIEEHEAEPDAPFLDQLFPNLLQSIATTELLLAKWCEPPEIDRLHLSTLIQQVMSLIAERGGARADQLFETLCERGGFSNVDQPTLAQVHRSMGAADLIEQTEEGLLILGLKGEKIVRSHDFYVAFVVSVEFRVEHEGRHIGNIVWETSAIGEEYLILAGRRWRILQVDPERRVISVEPSTGGKAPTFEGRSHLDIHPKVRDTMRSLLERDDVPSYLDATAKKMLAHARAAARAAQIPERNFLVERSTVHWFTWTGSRIQRTLHLLGRFYSDLGVKDDGIALTIDKSDDAGVKEMFRGFLQKCPDAESLAANDPNRAEEKYDRYLSDALLARNYARNRLDVQGALELIRAL
jgi:ATP-dependent Lhr-like helicase